MWATGPTNVHPLPATNAQRTVDSDSLRGVLHAMCRLKRRLDAGAVAVFAKGGPMDLVSELYATALEHCSPLSAGEEPTNEPRSNPT